MGMNVDDPSMNNEANEVADKDSCPFCGENPCDFVEHCNVPACMGSLQMLHMKKSIWMRMLLQGMLHYIITVCSLS